MVPLIAIPAFSEETAAKQMPAQPAASTPATAGDLSLYGEVRGINQAANSLSVQYYDYDNDEEKTTEIAVGNQTKLDGAAALADIKQNDWVDVIYTVSDAKFVAKSVIVEKESPADTVTPAAEENTDTGEEY